MNNKVWFYNLKVGGHVLTTEPPDQQTAGAVYPATAILISGSTTLSQTEISHQLRVDCHEFWMSLMIPWLFPPWGWPFWFWEEYFAIYWIICHGICRDIHGPHRMNINDLSYSLTFPLSATSWWKSLLTYWNISACTGWIGMKFSIICQ